MATSALYARRRREPLREIQPIYLQSFQPFGVMHLSNYSKIVSLSGAAHVGTRGFCFCVLELTCICEYRNSVTEPISFRASIYNIYE